MSNTEEKKNSEEWYNELYPNMELIILDPDGWDRKNWHYSWNEEKISHEEFQHRLMQSTVSNLSAIKHSQPTEK